MTGKGVETMIDEKLEAVDAEAVDAEAVDAEAVDTEAVEADGKAAAGKQAAAKEEPEDGGTTIAVPDAVRARMWIGGVVALVVLLAAGAFYLHLQAGRAADRVARIDAAVASAEQRVPAMLSYDAATLDEDLARAEEQTAGDFHDDYARILEDVVRPEAEKRQVTTVATVMATSVVSEKDGRVVVLMFLNQATSHGNGTPQIAGSRVEVTMARSGGDWKVVSLDAV